MSNDTIYRQEAIDAINEIIHTERMFPGRPKAYMARDAIKELPAANHTGRWLEIKVMDEPRGKHIQQWQSARCSNCNKYHTTPYLYFYTHYEYCPSCGAVMEARPSDQTD